MSPTRDPLVVLAPADAAEPALAHEYAHITRRIAGVPLRRHTPLVWWATFGGSMALVGVFTCAVLVLFYFGVGVWGVNIPVGWGFAIVNFVWWIGIGHAGTLISAILLLFRQDWRTSINRFAEAMTLFAVACAGLFPLLHLGRIWKWYSLFPYPSTTTLWPQWRSPLVWDVMAVSTYGTVSLLFWYIGLVPDLATLRDHARRKLPRMIYAFFALGWRGSAAHWRRHQVVYLLLAGIATPLVVSVHSVVSLDFTASIIPGWHATIFPPYFVAGAIYSGFAMVVVLAVLIRVAYGFGDYITIDHLDKMGKVMLCTGLIVAYGYGMEIFNAWYSDNGFEWAMMRNRMFGPYGALYWMLILCNIAVPQSLWLPAVRRTPALLFVVALFVQTGMWLERFVIVVTSLHRDFLPSSWGMYFPTIWDWATFIGTMGLFTSLFMLFLRVLPVISIAEIRELAFHHSHGESLTEASEKEARHV